MLLRHPIPLLLTPLLWGIGSVSARYALTLPPTIPPGSTTADFLTPSLDQSDLDSPKLSHVNASTFDLWHFDAVAIENPNASVAITFSNAGPVGFPLRLDTPNLAPPGGGNGTGNEREGSHALWAHIGITFPNGSVFTHIQPVSHARVSGSGDSSIALWSGAGGWMGSEEGYEVEIEVGGRAEEPWDGVGTRINGHISIERITSSHSVCSTGQNFSQALGLGNEKNGVGWVGVLPDGIAAVDVTVNGERVVFDGYGGHDKLWSSRPFTSSTKSLTRGRAHLGLYSLFWLSYTPSSSTSGSNQQGEIVSALLARDGEMVSAGCEPGTVTIIPGREQTEGGLVSGFQVSIPGAQVSVATDVAVAHGNGHKRWNGRARGVVEGRDEEGVAVFERFEY
ncbi:hypothetical protein BDV12DRAFT_210304 [Aspergillus spectabilis]